MSLSRDLASDYVRLADTLARLHFAAFVCLKPSSAAPPLVQGFA